ncbi:hypothetical protein [Nocardiopsis halotolerans]|uniref:hypothetical protein n=1 Tax=Nocardiopsis halotolerans TaxID=124252 RepID=UPI000349CEEA|nr:hypothetical protein [Nocardiopsis halotolerans]
MSSSPPVTAPPPPRLRPATVSWVALAWSAVVLTLGLGWLSGVVPVGVPDGFGSLSSLLPAGSAGVLALVLGTVGVVCAVFMLRARGSGGRLVEAGAWVLAGVALLVFVDGQLLSWLGYSMILPVVGWFVDGLTASWVEATFTASHLATLFFTAGAAVWAVAALTHRRAVRLACEWCGRAPGWTHGVERSVRVRALGVGRAAVTVACVVALYYPSLRFPWLFGVPVGIDEERFAAMVADGDTLLIGVGLGTAAVVGVVLMVGLVQRWGVRFPRWMVGLAGRRVPVWLAVAPATLVAMALVSMGRSTVVELLGDQGSLLTMDPVHAGAFVSMAVWGVALGVATAAYVVRRRAECGVCGRGLPEVAPRDLRAVGV